MHQKPAAVAASERAAVDAAEGEENLCPICLEQFADRIRLECGHPFCRLCLEGLKGSPNITCPVCRRPSVLRWLLPDPDAEEQKRPEKRETTFVSHTLEPFDTFPSLCVRYNTTVDAIRFHNHLMVPHLELLAPGTVLMIPVDEPPRPPAQRCPNEEEQLEKLRQQRMIDFMAAAYHVPRDEAAVYLRAHDWALEAAVATWRGDVTWEEEQMRIFRNEQHAPPHHCVERPRWVENKAHRGCMLCKKRFSVVRWRHHCRHCGKLICDSCTGLTAPLPQMGYIDPVRICNSCTPTGR